MAEEALTDIARAAVIALGGHPGQDATLEQLIRLLQEGIVYPASTAELSLSTEVQTLVTSLRKGDLKSAQRRIHRIADLADYSKNWD